MTPDSSVTATAVGARSNIARRNRGIRRSRQMERRTVMFGDRTSSRAKHRTAVLRRRVRSVSIECRTRRSSADRRRGRAVFGHRDERDLARLHHPEALPGKDLQIVRILQLRLTFLQLVVLLLELLGLPPEICEP